MGRNIDAALSRAVADAEFGPDQALAREGRGGLNVGSGSALSAVSTANKDIPQSPAIRPVTIHPFTEHPPYSDDPADNERIRSRTLRP